MRRGQLLPYLRPRLTANPDKPVMVRPLAEAPYGEAVEVLDLPRQGKQKLGLSGEINIALPTAREAAAWSR